MRLMWFQSGVCQNLRLTGFRASVLLIDLTFPAIVEALRPYAGYLVGGAGVTLHLASKRHVVVQQDE